MFLIDKKRRNLILYIIEKLNFIFFVGRLYFIQSGNFVNKFEFFSTVVISVSISLFLIFLFLFLYISNYYSLYIHSNRVAYFLTPYHSLLLAIYCYIRKHLNKQLLLFPFFLILIDYIQQLLI